MVVFIGLRVGSNFEGCLMGEDNESQVKILKGPQHLRHTISQYSRIINVLKCLIEHSTKW